MSKEIRFILNQEEVKTNESAGILVLDFLRRNKQLTGTKEGCKEGDCGACMVLIGELANNRVNYNPVTSCLIPLAEIHGKHLVTIEGLNSDGLSPVQHAIVEYGGSQCGFCTPGIVVSFTGYLLQEGKILDDSGIKYALGGNLCRCTGYSSLKRAGNWIARQIENGTNNKSRVDDLIQKGYIPEYFKSIPDRLKKIPPIHVKSETNPDYLIAGGTDIYVQKGELMPDSLVKVLNLEPGMKSIERQNDEIHVGALTTFEEFANNPEIIRIIPDIGTYNLFNASWQIRNRATLGGNIINASPIGDMTILLLALNSTLVFENNGERHVPLKSFYKGYKQIDKHPSEILTRIIIPVPSKGSKINFEKVSKRKTLDIASVNSAIRTKVTDNKIEEIELSIGGVSPVPLYMQQTCDFLNRQVINVDTIREASNIALAEISPISDVHGSKDYKRLLVNQFIFLHFSSLYPGRLESRDYYEA